MFRTQVQFLAFVLARHWQLGSEKIADPHPPIVRKRLRAMALPMLEVFDSTGFGRRDEQTWYSGKKSRR